MKKLTLASVALVASIAAGGCADTTAPDEFNSEIDADVAVVPSQAATPSVSLGRSPTTMRRAPFRMRTMN